MTTTEFPSSFDHKITEKMYAERETKKLFTPDPKRTYN